MFRYISKNKSLLIILAVVLASFIWMTSQVREPGGPSLLEKGVSALAYPFVKAVDVVTDGTRSVWEGYFRLHGLVRKNQRLQEDNNILFTRNISLREELARLGREDELALLKNDLGAPAVTASVIGRDATSWFRTVWVDAGGSDGIKKNMPAAVYCGIVGRVMKPYSGSSRVMLITNPGSSVSCITERSRENGILVGMGSSTCTLNYVDKKSDVQVGDLVITSGLDRVFPKGLPVGVVTKVNPLAPGYFQEVRVKPTADLDHLEDILVLLYEPPAMEQ